MDKLRIAFAPGVTPGKWLDRFIERYPQIELQATREDYADVLGLLVEDRADAVFVRYSGPSPKDETRHVIPLYEELEVVCAAKDHDIEYYDEPVPQEVIDQFGQVDLADYPEEVGGIPTAMEVVASGAQVLRVPQSIARLFHRKDVIYREVQGGHGGTVGIAWRTGLEDSTIIDEFIGIVRGRSANSSRQASVRQSEQQRKKSGTAKRPTASRGGQKGSTPARSAAKRPKKRR